MARLLSGERAFMGLHREEGAEEKAVTAADALEPLNRAMFQFNDKRAVTRASSASVRRLTGAAVDRSYSQNSRGEIFFAHVVSLRLIF